MACLISVEFDGEDGGRHQAALGQQSVPFRLPIYQFPSVSEGLFSTEFDKAVDARSYRSIT
jgi:hypothetical protein